MKLEGKVPVGYRGVPDHGWNVPISPSYLALDL